MKVLFLDVDGVLNSEEWFRADPHKTDSDWLGLRSVDPTKVEIIKVVLAETGATLVLSSTWRLVADYVQTLRDFGLPIDDTTPVLETSNRGEEITAWLRLHPEADVIAIVDDDDDAGDCELYPRLVQTTWQRGLQPEHATKLIRLLGRSAGATLP